VCLECLTSNNIIYHYVVRCTCIVLCLFEWSAAAPCTERRPRQFRCRRTMADTMHLLRIRGTKLQPSPNEPSAETGAGDVRRLHIAGLWLIYNIIEFASRNQRGGEFALGSLFLSPLLVRRIARDTRFECFNTSDYRVFGRWFFVFLILVLSLYIYYCLRRENSRCNSERDAKIS